MAIRSYQKAMAYHSLALTNDMPLTNVRIAVETTPPTTIWDLLGGLYSGVKHLTASSSLAGLMIPLLLISGGGWFIYQQFAPTITSEIKANAGYAEQGTTALVADNYITNRMQYVSNPGADYFQSISQTALSQNLALDPKVEAFSGAMYLTIPSLGFDRLPITANVNSVDQSSYDSVLTGSLAHFKGTNLPFSTSKGNMVIYGHSASGTYHPTPSDVLAAFSFLPDLKVGDMITLEINGKEYHYQMTRSKIVQPSDISIVSGTAGKNTLTLFTCYPPGNSSQRYVAIANPV